MRRILAIFLCFLTIFILFAAVALAAPEYNGEVKPNAVMLIDANTGTVLYEKNINERIRPASTTKILTCILAIENSNMDDKVVISGTAAGQRGSVLGVVQGEEVVMEDLLNGMMMASGNDAAVAVAEHVGGSISGFVDMMNQKAQELGMTSSHFATVHGKDNDDHWVTASDMAKLARYAMQNADFRKIVNQSEYTMPTTNKRQGKTEDTTNQLMLHDEDGYYSYATGVKTGSTPKADGCVVASATKDGMDLICLIFGDEPGTDRWPLAEGLFEWGFDNYETVELSSVLASAEPVQVQVENYAANDASEGLLEFETAALTGKYTTLEKSIVQGLLDGTGSVEVTATYSTDVKAPILQGNVLGTVTYTDKESVTIIYRDNLVAPRDVLEMGQNSSGGTAVATLPPTVPEKIVTLEDNAGKWFWLLIPSALIAFLIIRLLMVNKRKRTRFKRHKPRYSYKIKR